MLSKNLKTDRENKTNYIRVVLIEYIEAVARRFSIEGALSNFAKFTEKHLYQSFFFNKVAGLRSAVLLKKRLWHRCKFSYEFCEISKNTFFTEHLWWLLLNISKMWMKGVSTAYE